MLKAKSDGCSDYFLDACTSVVQAKQLRELFEQYGMRQGYLNILADKMGPQWKKSNVSAHLKRLGLSQGKRVRTSDVALDGSASPSPVGRSAERHTAIESLS